VAKVFEIQASMEDEALSLLELLPDETNDHRNSLT
jgi:hypothetical protein